MKLVYRDFSELYSTLRGKTVEIKPKEYIPAKKVDKKDRPKLAPKRPDSVEIEPVEVKEEEKPKKKTSRKKKEE